jgi:hypothetical protein
MSGSIAFLERFWSKVDQRGECWEWTASRSDGGYGTFFCRHLPGGTARPAHAHRIAYELSVGPVPNALTLDHLCRNRGCVNPAHLEPVTRGENVLRGIGIFAENKRKTHCPLGHEYTPENTAPSGNGRRCRTCKNARDNRAYQRRRGTCPR